MTQFYYMIFCRNFQNYRPFQVSQERAFFSEMVVDAVNQLDDRLSLSMIGIKKVSGGNLLVRFLPIFENVVKINIILKFISTIRCKVSC